MKKMNLKKGFTLVELMVVMAIIAVLSVLIIGAIQIARKTSLETVHRGNGRTIQTGLESFYAKNKNYPYTSADYSFDALKGTLGISLTQTTECDDAAKVNQKGGGLVTFSSTGYTIKPYDSACSVALGLNDQIANN